MGPLAFLFNESPPLAPMALDVPVPFHYFFQGVHKVHSVWHWQRRAKLVYEQPRHFQQLLAGYAVQYIWGDRTLVRLAAHTALIGIRLVDLVHQEACFRYACHYWMDAMSGRLVIHIPRVELRHRWPSMIPVSTQLWVDYHLESLSLRIHLVIRASILLMVETFKLSMTLMDTLEAFSFHPNTQTLAVQEVFISTTRVVEGLIHNKEFLIQSLEDNEVTIRWLLHKSGSHLSVRDLTETVRTSIDYTEVIYQGACQASNLLLEEVKAAAWSVCFFVWGTAPHCLLPRKKILGRIKNERVRSIQNGLNGGSYASRESGRGTI